jgi:hypothetical protein
VFLYLLLGKIQSRVQIVALFLILVAASVLNMGSTQENPIEGASYDASSYEIGIALVLSASAISGLSGALSQKALSNIEKPRHSILLSSEMAVYGIVFITVRMIFTQDEVL